jgi:hypothetical protein
MVGECVRCGSVEAEEKEGEVVGRGMLLNAVEFPI